MICINLIFLITIIFFALEIQMKAYYKLYFWGMFIIKSAKLYEVSRFWAMLLICLNIFLLPFFS